MNVCPLFAMYVELLGISSEIAMWSLKMIERTRNDSGGCGLKHPPSKGFAKKQEEARKFLHGSRTCSRPLLFESPESVQVEEADGVGVKHDNKEVRVEFKAAH